MNLSKNKNDLEQIEGKAIEEYKQTKGLEDGQELNEFFRKGWNGNALELIIDILLNYYSISNKYRKGDHTLLSENLIQIGVHYF